MHDGLAEFAYEDRTFAFAMLRDDPTAPLVRLPEGEAKSRRAFTKANLMCPYPRCETPDLTTVSRTARGHRDGYRHLRRTTSHEREGWYHLLSKAAVLHWAQAHPAIASAATEVRVGPRTADVLLTGHHGHQIAVEIQYAALSLDEWRERSASYRSLGVTPVWLWGHVGHHGPSVFGQGWLRDVQREVLAAGQPLLWINPTLEQLAWATGEEGRLPDVGATTASLTIVDLDDRIEVTPSGLFPPGWHEAAEATRLHEEALRRAEEEKEQRTRRLIERARAQTPPPPDYSWDYWQARMPMRPGALCDVCKFPVLPGQARSRRRHEVCDYLM